MNMEFVQWLDDLRHDIGKPIIISSGYRCPDHNKAIGGTDNSAHTRGLAVDIHVSNSFFRYQLLSAALIHGCKRMGVYKTWIHLDLDPSLPDAIWYG